MKDKAYWKHESGIQAIQTILYREISRKWDGGNQVVIFISIQGSAYSSASNYSLAVWGHTSHSSGDDTRWGHSMWLPDMHDRYQNRGKRGQFQAMSADKIFLKIKKIGVHRCPRNW